MAVLLTTYLEDQHHELDIAVRTMFTNTSGSLFGAEIASDKPEALRPRKTQWLFLIP